MEMELPIISRKAPSIHAHTGLRGIAAVTVVIAHLALNKIFPEFSIFSKIYPLFSWYNQCVDLFFILSGFILNWVYMQVGQVNWRAYLSARLARILPLYFLTLAFMLALDFYTWAVHGIASQDFTIRALLGNLFMFAGLWGGHPLCINVPSWSVCVEMVLYITMFPLLCLGTAILRGRNVKILILTLCSIGFVACYESPIWPDWAEMGRGIFGFTAGFLCCSLWRQITVSPRLNNIVGISACVAAIGAILQIIPGDFLVVTFPFIVFCTVGDSGIAGKVLSHRFLTWLGERSYSIYLWHYPLIIFFNRLLVYSHVQPDGSASMERRLLAYTLIVLCCAFSANVSYRFFECPARDWLRHLLGKRALSRTNVKELVSS